MTKELKPSNDDIDTHLKPYHAPKLVTYGDVREITKASGGTNTINDMGGGPDKTA